MTAACSTKTTPEGTEKSREEWLEFFLKEQQSLTAVDRFSQSHEQSRGPAQERYYRELIPLDTPKPGQQYAFEVDLDDCTGCKACVTACHNLNGLDDDESWRSVGLLVGGIALPMQQMVTAACHHCADPACFNGCPVKAYDKDAVTGIVKHLDDQCIGCQYCILKCPYDVPKYNPARGIVRKCDMCSSRLEAREAPACVQACPNTAIRIKIVDHSTLLERAAADAFLPGAPGPKYTLPSTHYKTAKKLRKVRAIDEYALRPEPAHLPLVFMLVLTQLCVGAFAFDQVLSWLAAGAYSAVRPYFVSAALATGIIGLNVALLHLGRPLYAFRALLGLRTSWMSREILVFGLFAGAASHYAASFWLPIAALQSMQSALGIATLVLGLLGVFCSAMIYIDTQRIFWNARYTFAKFFLSVPLLGAAAALTVMNGDAEAVQWIAFALATVTIFKLGFENWTLGHAFLYDLTPLRKSALLIEGALRRPNQARFLLAAIGGLILPLLLASGMQVPPTMRAMLPGMILALCVGAELFERYLFFRAVVPLKMPGGSSK